MDYGLISMKDSFLAEFAAWLPRSHKDVNKIMEVINGGK